MKFWIVSIFLFLAPFVQCFAFSATEELSVDDRVIYYQTLSMCDNTNRQYAEKSSIWFQSFINSGAIDTVIKKKYNSQNSPLNTSPKFNNLTSSMGFHYAVRECFGNDKTMEMLFFTSLLSLDISGKFSSWVVDLTLLRPLYWGIRGAAASAKLTTIEIGKRYFWFRIFFSYSAKQMTFAGVNAFKVMLPVFAASTAGEAYSRYRAAQDQVNIFSGKTPEKIKELEKENAHFKLLISKSTNAEEIEDLRLFIDQNNKMLEHLKS